MRQHPLVSLAALSLLLTAACAGGDHRTPAVAAAATVRDSAGVQIVENHGPTWPAGAEWRVAQQPLADLGAEGGAVEGDLGRVATAFRLDDGRLVVIASSPANIQFFDSLGTPLKTVGRSGAGPGEFRALGNGWRTGGDTIEVFDFANRRVSTFDGQGGYVRGMTVTTASRFSFALPIGRLPDGRLLTQSQTFDTSSSHSGPYRSPSEVVLYGPDAGTADTLGAFPGAEMYPSSFEVPGGRRFPAPRPLPFGRTTQVRSYGDNVYVATNNAFEVAVYGGDGTLRRLIRAPRTREQVTEADVSAERARMLEQLDGSRGVPQALKEQERKRIEEAPHAEEYPYLAGLLLDEQGNLWIGLPAAPDAEQNHFVVFSPVGQELGTVVLPGRLRPTDIGSDYVIGIWRDQDDIEHVRLYRLTKPS